MSYRPRSISIRNRTAIRMQVKSKKLTGLVFYVAGHMNERSGDFLSVSLMRGVVELRYQLGIMPVTVVKSSARVSNGEF